MSLEFDLTAVATVEFGIGLGTEAEEGLVLLPVDGGVQNALKEMATETWNQMQSITDDPSRYDPSEKHSSTDYLVIPTSDDLVPRLREVHRAVNLPSSSSALSHPEKVSYYCARLKDTRGRRITAMRRATQFKGVLRSRLITLSSDTMRMIEDKIFKLDQDFDLLIDAHTIHILRPSGFESLGGLTEAILACVPKNITSLKADLPFAVLDGVEKYALQHPRAARYLASICTSQRVSGINITALAALCKDTGVAIQNDGSNISIDGGHELGFLEVLDRRRYEVELIKGQPEKYRAASRSKLDGASTP